jgi:hypothetical protein
LAWMAILKSKMMQGTGSRWKLRVCPVTSERPHGIRYSLTLHAPDNTRLIGFDNAHSVKPVGSRFKHAGKKFPYDHRHRHALDEGVLYEFDTAYQLVSDFYAEVDRVLKEISP